MNTNLNFNIQSHLLIGQPEELRAYTIELLQKQFCKNNSCRICITCQQIIKNNHHSLLWLKPERQYTLEQLEIIFDTICFTLDQNEKFFIIFENADLLNSSCSNRLLKSIEEPPKGYYFIFLTDHKEAILPTVKSRCVITNLDQDSNNSNYPFPEISSFFIDISKFQPNNFLKIIDKSQINDRETIDLLDWLIKYWINKYKDSISTNDVNESEKNIKMIKLLTESFKKNPMPGGSKIFWKNLYLQLN